jgi:CBS domain-containing protein
MSSVVSIMIPKVEEVRDGIPIGREGFGMTVSCHMNGDTLTISRHATIRDAVNLMHVKEVDDLIVVDEDHGVVGSITGQEIVQLFKAISPTLSDVPSIYRLLSLIGSNALPVKTLIRTIDLAKNYTVESVMTRDVLTVWPEDLIVMANKIMTANGLDRLPVVDKQNKLKGVIKRQDIVNACFLRMCLGASKSGSISRSEYRELNSMLAA